MRISILYRWAVNGDIFKSGMMTTIRAVIRGKKKRKKKRCNDRRYNKNTKYGEDVYKQLIS